MATLNERVGRATLNQLDYIGGLSIQLWAAVRALGAALPVTGNRYRWKASVGQMPQIGVDAMPMVGLMAVCAGFILAMQGPPSYAASERCSMSSIWSWSASRANWGHFSRPSPSAGGRDRHSLPEIGTMVVTEEVNALRVMAFEPIEFVLAPKYLAALITVPCLSILSNVCGIFAGGIFMFFST
jgi:phospholipid/cholesterol/gamma-HCH transport system permease protein